MENKHHSGRTSVTEAIFIFFLSEVLMEVLHTDGSAIFDNFTIATNSLVVEENTLQMFWIQNGFQHLTSLREYYYMF